MAKSVGVCFIDESDFQKEGKWYILSKNSQYEVCSTVSSDTNGLLAGISDFSEDIVLETGRDSGGNSSHDVIVIRNPRHQQFLHPSIEKEQSCGYTLFERLLNK